MQTVSLRLVLRLLNIPCLTLAVASKVGVFLFSQIGCKLFQKNHFFGTTCGCSVVVLSWVLWHSRAAYHNAIRKARRDEEMIVSERIVASMLSSRDRDFWSEI